MLAARDLGRRASWAIVATEQADLFRRGGPFLFTTVSLASVTISATFYFCRAAHLRHSSVPSLIISARTRLKAFDDSREISGS